MLALFPPGEPVFNPDAKKHRWGKRKLKWDQSANGAGERAKEFARAARGTEGGDPH